MNAPFLIGSSLVLASAGGVTLSLFSGAKRRIRHTEAILDLIGCIRSEIDFFLRPVAPILADYRNEALEECGFLPVMRERGLRAAAESGTASLTDGTVAVLCRFADSLGGGYKEEQLRLCDFTCSGIAEELNRARNELERDGNVYRFVPILSALFIILCFL
ncbi:MAG: hypothetical protein IJS78_04795 [Clostridia bacterium]|nr:hypothetical protein [Clostridia bacterium]